IQEYCDKEEQIKKAEEEAKLYVISKTKVIKVVREEAKKLGIYPKEAISTKAGELFKKAQDAEHEVLKSQHAKKIHPKTKLVVITVYRGIDGRNFDVHKPFLIRAFGISELDELREIIPKKKNTMVKDSMNSLSRRKQKHMELKPETRIPGLEYNRTLPQNVLFVNNTVIEEPEYEIFFTDEFAASMVKSPENERFSMKLRKLIAEHLDQEKFKSKKVKLEALGYNMD
nr:hypothetical protein [Tanacetum cinerariifolium]GFA39542.1 hypothetical protein [Tanacetum cinerariifolium]